MANGKVKVGDEMFRILPPKTERELLQERGDKYGTPGRDHPAALDNLRCADELIKVYLRYSGRTATEKHHEVCDGHDYAIIQVLAKIARMATGQHHEDNYTDAKGYLELARVAGGATAPS